MLNFLQRLHIATKLWLLIGVFSLVGVADNLTEMALVSQRLHVEKEAQLRHLVEVAHTALQSYERAARDGRLSQDAARRQAAEAVRQLHYGALEYFWIHDLSQPVPTMVMHPTVPALEGQPLTDARFNRGTSMRSGQQGDYQALTERNLFVAMNQASAATGDGFVTYDWPKPIAAGGVTEGLYPKLSYVKRFEPWGWVVGSGIYIDDLEAEYWRDARLRLFKAGLWLTLLGVLVWFILRTVVQPLRAFQATIDGLRADPRKSLELPAAQPGELGQLSVSFVRLVEDLRRSRNELTLSIDRLRQTARAFASMKEGILITDASGRILSINPAFTRLSGYEPEDVVGKTTALLRSEAHDDAFYAGMWARLLASGQWTGQVSNRTKSGDVRQQWVTILAARDRRGAVRCYVALYWEADEADNSAPPGTAAA
jgi:methyl-accepting chemotaxis protein